MGGPALTSPGSRVRDSDPGGQMLTGPGPPPPVPSMPPPPWTTPPVPGAPPVVEVSPPLAAVSPPLLPGAVPPVPEDPPFSESLPQATTDIRVSKAQDTVKR